ncbi:MAG: GatB/YqeY domain-containing protein [Methanobrevibacter sp.]|nr:GatB/YqeY domain-containing protein [Methanobrevibacter sp.]
MENFLQYLDTQIQLEMKLSAVSDGKRLTGLRNVKSDFTYAKSQKGAKDFSDIIKSMYKSRLDTSELYKDSNNDLYVQELIEAEILKQFLPKEISEEELFAYFEALPIKRSKTSFKLYQDAAKDKFGYTPDSQLILKFITNN